MDLIGVNKQIKILSYIDGQPCHGPHHDLMSFSRVCHALMCIAPVLVPLMVRPQRIVPMCIMSKLSGAMQPTSFEVEEDTSSWPAYERGGLVTTTKQPKKLSFKSLEQAIAEPGEFLLSDFSKLERPALLHVGFQALDAFEVGAAPGLRKISGNMVQALRVLCECSGTNLS